MKGGRIKPESIQRVKDAANILDVVREFIPDLKKSGSNWVACSPLTDERTPSFNVVPRLNIFNDFSAQKRGDSIKFLIEYQRMSFIEAIEWLASRYNIELEREYDKRGKVDSVIMRKRALMYEINDWMRGKFEKWLWNDGRGSRGLDYLLVRGVDEWVIKLFGLGYSPDSYNALRDSARSEKKYVSYKDLVDASAIKQKENASSYYDFFRDRVMFPIRDYNGRVIGFTGRTIKVSEADRVPKYLNSRESAVFKKSESFFGLYESLKEIRLKNEVYIVEGPMDVLGFWQAGIKNVVASNGVALTRRGVSLLSRYTTRFVIAMDSDAAGEKGIELGLPLLMRKMTSEDGRVDIVVFNDVKDPFDFVARYGADSLRSYVESSRKDFIEARISYLWRGETVHRTAQIIRQLIYSISYVEDRILRFQYLKRLSELTGVDMRDIQQVHHEIESKRQEKDDVRRLTRDEHLLLKILVKFGTHNLDSGESIERYVKKNFDDYDFSNLFREQFRLYERWRGGEPVEYFDSLKQEKLKESEFLYRFKGEGPAEVLNEILPMLIIDFIGKSEGPVKDRLVKILEGYPAYK